MRLSFFIILLFSLTRLPAQNQLAIPDTLTGPVINLNIAPGTRSFYPGQITNTMGVNGDYLGPTLMLRKGDFVTMNVTNNIPDTTTIHWHGMHVPALADGGPHIFVLPGATWSPSFQVMDKASMHWYHPHLHMKTAEHVTKGAAGLIYVRDTEEDSLALPRTYGIDDIPLVVQTRAFDANKQFIVESALDSVVLINGTKDAFVDLPAQVVRLRLLNAATERAFNFGFSNNQTFYQIGSDGGLLNAPVSMTRLLLAPGERAEILVDLSGMNGQSMNLMSYASQIPAGIYGALNPQAMGQNSIPNYTLNPLNGANFNLLQVNIVPVSSNPVTTIPVALANIQPIPAAQADKTRDFVFSALVGGPTGSLLGPFVINNMSFDMMMINDTVKLNDTEIWQLTNQSRISHPFHVHDVQFFILDINGVPPSPGMAGRKDVVLVPPLMGTVRIIAKFEDFADPVWPYMYHCHMLTHEDDGMMGQFIVVDSSTGIGELTHGEAGMFSVYPNPVESGEVTISWNGNAVDNAPVLIFDLDGKLIKDTSVKLRNTGTYKIAIGNLPPGLYIIRLDTGSEFHHQKFLVTE